MEVALLIVGYWRSSITRLDPAYVFGPSITRLDYSDCALIEDSASFSAPAPQRAEIVHNLTGDAMPLYFFNNLKIWFFSNFIKDNENITT